MCSSDLSGDPTWWPGHHELEACLEEEMVRANTLENPYTVEYLEYLLQKHGFEEVVRYHGVNGFFPVSKEHLTLKEAAVFRADVFNTFTARKPGLPGYLAAKAVLAGGGLHARIGALARRFSGSQ